MYCNMTSKDTEIQEIYDEIKKFKSPHWNLCECEKSCSSCVEIIKSNMENNKYKDIPSADELDGLLRRLTSFEYYFISRPFKWEEPFIPVKKIRYSDAHYHIIFIEYGIHIVMTIDMIKKISILNSILLQKNGSDKPLRLTFYDLSLNKVFKGPYLYITRMEPHSLMFNKPPESYVMNIDRKHGGEDINFKEKWFKFDNLAECLLYRNWYT